MKEILNLLEQSGDKVVVANDAGEPQAVVLSWADYQALLAGKVVSQTILVTGGAGYIGAHVARLLKKASHKVIVIDNLSTGSKSNLDDGIEFIEGDFADPELLNQIFSSNQIDAVMHFAASIEVGESVEKPVEYFDNNVAKTNALLRAMVEHNVYKFIFSSTAAIYGLQDKVPISELADLGPLDPYGYSKLIGEQLISYYTKFTPLKAVVFRYFNAAGSDFDQKIYSAHQSHLIPRVIDAIQGRLDKLQIHGSDYSTPDGTGVRDYVHVLDIARAHISALTHFDNIQTFDVFNIGTSTGVSVKEILDKAQELFGKEVPHEFGPRRAGDTPITVADNAKLVQTFNFQLQYSDIETILKTSFR